MSPPRLHQNGYNPIPTQSQQAQSPNPPSQPQQQSPPPPVTQNSRQAPVSVVAQAPPQQSAQPGQGQVILFFFSDILIVLLMELYLVINAHLSLDRYKHVNLCNPRLSQYFRSRRLQLLRLRLKLVNKHKLKPLLQVKSAPKLLVEHRPPGEAIALSLTHRVCNHQTPGIITIISVRPFVKKENT